MEQGQRSGQQQGNFKKLLSKFYGNNLWTMMKIIRYGGEGGLSVSNVVQIQMKIWFHQNEGFGTGL